MTYPMRTLGMRQRPAASWKLKPGHHLTVMA